MLPCIYINMSDNVEPVLESVLTAHERKLQSQRAYRESHKAEIYANRNQVLQCECGSSCTRHHLSRHVLTKGHLDYMRQKQSIVESTDHVSDQVEVVQQPISSGPTYYQANKEKVAETQRRYRQEHKYGIHARRTEIVTCECGSQCSRHHLASHRRTKLHQSLMQETPELPEPIFEVAPKSPAVNRNEKIACECGCEIARSNIAAHRKTKRHAELMKQKTEV